MKVNDLIQNKAAEIGPLAAKGRVKFTYGAEHYFLFPKDPEVSAKLTDFRYVRDLFVEGPNVYEKDSLNSSYKLSPATFGSAVVTNVELKKSRTLGGPVLYIVCGY